MGHHGEKVGAARFFNTAILWQAIVPLMVRETHPTFLSAASDTGINVCFLETWIFLENLLNGHAAGQKI
jgi:hypothetical protein